MTSCYCPTILENPCEESRLQSHRNPTGQEELNQLLPSVEMHNRTLNSDCTSIDRVDLSQPSRSISLVEQLKRQLSNQKQCNLPRQIKSLFSCDSNHDEKEKMSKRTQRCLGEDDCDNLTKKEYDDIMAGKILARYDLPRSEYCPLKRQPIAESHKTLKQSIYERLMQTKRQKEKLRFSSRKDKQNIKQATFQPSKSKGKDNIINNRHAKIETASKIKDIIKNKLINNIINLESQPKHSTKKPPCAQFFININMEADSRVSSPQTKPNYLNKYQNLLKENVNSANSNFVSSNKHNNKHNIYNMESKANYESFMRSLKLRQSLMKPVTQHQQSASNNRLLSSRPQKSKDPESTRNRSMTSLTFEERQKRLLNSRSEKIVKHQLEKQKDELKGCTFKPQLTPYYGFHEKDMQQWRSYTQLNKRKSNINRIY